MSNGVKWYCPDVFEFSTMPNLTLRLGIYKCNKRARKYGRGTETISETAGRIANVHSDGNPRTNEITDKGFSDWNKDSDIKLSAKAAIHAMVGLGESGRDNTGGAHGWDGISDFQKQYKVRTT